MTDQNQTSGIKSWPSDDRPREKLLKKVAGALTNSELLAILLRTGAQGVSAIDLARQVIDKFGSFRNMNHTDAREWKTIKGLGSAKIAQIQAALEIGRRFRDVEINEPKQKISSSREVVHYVIPQMQDQMRDLKIEIFKVVYLNSNNRIIEIADAARGTVNHATPIVREIIHAALQKYATAVICVHNHPSGNISPSPEDKKFTQELMSAGKLMEIRVLDHIIIGDGAYFSFADEGIIG